MVVVTVANAYKAGHTDKKRHRNGKTITAHPLYKSVLWKYGLTVAKFQHGKREWYKSTSNLKCCVFLSSCLVNCVFDARSPWSLNLTVQTRPIID